MTLSDWHEEPISKSHDRKSFDCGDADLNGFLQKHARQNHENGSAKTFCAIDDANPARVLGFYSLAPSSLAFDRLPDALPRHAAGGFLLARLATDKDLQGRGLGGQLLLAAGKRCLRVADESGGIMMVIDAKNARAAEWYEGYGALRLEDTPLTLVLSLKTVRAILDEVGKL
jgi:GNAT superfamily N-acetyltransferase